MSWEDVETAVGAGIKGLAFDGCHKIYVLLDEEQVQQSREWGYGEDGSMLIVVKDDSFATWQDSMRILRDWYDQSCGLRFIDSVSTVAHNPNAGYTVLIGQGELDDDDDDFFDEYDFYDEEDDDELG